MNKILVNDAEINVLELDFPMIVHGEDKSGASLYTVSLAANFHAAGKNVVCLSGYEMAQKEFFRQVRSQDVKAKFFVQHQVEEFVEYCDTVDDALVIIKNIELFEYDILRVTKRNASFILSGNLQNVTWIEKLNTQHYRTKIYFSALADVQIPKLEKYEGFIQSKTLNGKTHLLLSPI